MELEEKDVLILALETSCDETSAAVVRNGTDVLSNVISSQIGVHQVYGGVVPEIASRKHMENIIFVAREALDKSACGSKKIDGVAVTYGPGLVGALLVGLSFGKAAAYALNVPLLGVNHLIAHIYAGFLTEPDARFPVVSLVASGGHTNIVHLPAHGEFEILGETRDDAAGEVLDKVARAMGLKYPGGPEIEKLAAGGSHDAFEFPRAWLEEGSLDFSYSGLKSAVLNFLNHAQAVGETLNPSDVAASLQEAVVDVLVDKTAAGARAKKARTVMLAGGVAANSRLRSRMQMRLAGEDIDLVVPPPVLCTDNAAMVACAAYYQYQAGEYSDLDLNAVPNLQVGTGF